MSDRPTTTPREPAVTRDEMRDAIDDERLEAGRLLGIAREDWRRELDLVLSKFKNEMRILLAVAVLVVKFKLPDPVTVGAVGLVFAKAAFALWRGP